MPAIAEIEDLKRLYKRRVPKMFYDYCESGSWTEQTFRDNSSDFDLIRLRQRVAVDMTNRTTKSQMIGTDVAMPVALAPVGSQGMQHADGEILAAKAAEKFGVPYTLSTMSVCSIEDVAENTSAPFWFQLYVMNDRKFEKAALERAKAAGCSARNNDVRNGLTVPIKPSLHNIVDLATKWRWIYGMAKTKRHSFGNIVGHIDGISDMTSLSAWAAESFDPKLDWERVKEIKKLWGGPLILKGILDAEDAKMALQVGADAIIVSNHGGRQLDGAMSSIKTLPSIMDAVGDKVEVHLDGGIRSGQDVLKALAMGAKGTYIGRSFIYGLGAMGQHGVAEALRVIHNELDITMALCGERDVANLGKHNLLIPKNFEGDWV
ncbi:alpha-hydroxy-acid oxidizing protein [Litoreibacter sp.]|nr:alpha-hydroxy-acid oxidizing protein [Litoreibacter sp.]